MHMYIGYWYNGHRRHWYNGHRWMVTGTMVTGTMATDGTGIMVTGTMATDGWLLVQWLLVQWPQMDGYWYNGHGIMVTAYRDNVICTCTLVTGTMATDGTGTMATDGWLLVQWLLVQWPQMALV